MRNISIQLIIFVFSFSAYGQEICDNAIDDDGDGFVDLNDDECDCEIFSNITAAGDLCDGDLVLTSATDTSGGTWQWFLEGIALISETDISIDVDTYGFGNYSAVYFVDDYCERSDYAVEELVDVIANFDFDSNCLGETTEFTNTSVIGVGAEPSWLWNFGGDGISTAENPSHEFTDAGTYLVQLIVINDAGCNDTSEIDITIDPFPVAHFEFVIDGISSEDGLTGGCISNTVQFNDLSTVDDPGEVTSWNWNFGDLETSTDENPTHEYATTGSYIVTLVIETEHGCAATYLLDIFMTDNPSLDLIFNDPSCFGYADGSITVNVSGAFDIVFMITDEADSLRNIDNSNTANLLGAGWYYISISDGMLCSAMDSILLEQPNEIELDFIVMSEDAGADGSIDLTVAGDFPPFTYDWNIDGTGDFDDTEDLSDLSFGTYIIAVQDAEGCIASDTIIVTGPLAVQGFTLVDLSVYPNPITNALTIETPGKYKYQLSALNGDIILEGNGTDKELVSLDNLAAGTYFLRVENEQGVEIIKLIKQKED